MAGNELDVIQKTIYGNRKIVKTASRLTNKIILTKKKKGPLPLLCPKDLFSDTSLAINGK